MSKLLWSCILRIILYCFYIILAVFPATLTVPFHVDQLTLSQENVVDLQWLESGEVHPDELEVVARNMAAHLRHVLDQRDNHLEVDFIVIHDCLDVVFGYKGVAKCA